MRKILYIIPLFILAFTFTGNPPGWYEQTIPVNKQITDIHFIDTVTGWAITTWAPEFDTGYVLHTTNGGNNWNIQFREEVSFLVMQFTDENTGYAGGGDGFPKLYKTTNKGVNWLLHNPIPAHSIVDLFFLNNDTGWGCDDDPLFGGLWKTTNGGINWVEQLDENVRPSKLFFINSDTGWALGSGNNLYRTINGGNNWSVQYGFPTGMVDLFFVNNDTGWAIRNSNNGIFKTSDGGFNWINSGDPFPTNSGLNDIFFLNPNKGWIATYAKGILALNENGIWGTQEVPSGIAQYYAVYMIDTNTGFAGGTKLIKTTDGGGEINNITQISSEIPDGFQLHQNYPNPFNPTTNIKFKVQRSKNVKLSIYDISGRELAALLDEKLLPGEYEYKFDGSNLTSGIYFYTLIADGISVDTKKMVLVK